MHDFSVMPECDVGVDLHVSRVKRYVESECNEKEKEMMRSAKKNKRRKEGRK
jgi:hypothetical protein